MDSQFHPTLYNECNYLSVLGWKLIHVNKKGPRKCIHLDVLSEDLFKSRYLSINFPIAWEFDRRVYSGVTGSDRKSLHLKLAVLSRRNDLSWMIKRFQYFLIWFPSYQQWKYHSYTVKDCRMILQMVLSWIDFYQKQTCTTMHLDCLANMIYLKYAHRLGKLVIRLIYYKMCIPMF